MLTIENIEKIKWYSYDVQWTCDSVRETDIFYHFVVQRTNINGKICDVKKISLSRVEEILDGGYFYNLYLDDKKTDSYVSIDYVKDPNNLANCFTTILGEYARN